MTIINSLVYIIVKIKLKQIILPHEYIGYSCLLRSFLLEGNIEGTILSCLNALVEGLLHSIKVLLDLMNARYPLIKI